MDREAGEGGPGGRDRSLPRVTACVPRYAVWLGRQRLSLLRTGAKPMRARSGGAMRLTETGYEAKGHTKTP